MNKLVGIKWGELSEETQEWLLENASCIDGGDCGIIKEGKCIVDLTDELSVSGKNIDNEIVIDNNAIIYNPTEGIELISKEPNFTVNEIMTVSEAAEKWGITEGAIRASIKSRKFILGVDFRKAGRITLITKDAMVKLYGELKL